jgi:hypothetical protein
MKLVLKSLALLALSGCVGGLIELPDGTRIRQPWNANTPAQWVGGEASITTGADLPRTQAEIREGARSKLIYIGGGLIRLWGLGYRRPQISNAWRAGHWIRGAVDNSPPISLDRLGGYWVVRGGRRDLLRARNRGEEASSNIIFPQNSLPCGALRAVWIKFQAAFSC